MSKIERKAWSAEEDRLLQDLRQNRSLDWIEVARQIGDRNPSQCAQRWKRIKGYKLRRQWTSQEDEKLKNFVREFGYHWSRISKFMPNRSGKQIREHYLNQLHPDLNNEPWSVEEDEKIIQIYNSVGGRWSIIQKQLSGRSENSIKNRFYSYLRNKYFNIKNPYYVVPEKDNLTQLKKEPKLCKTLDHEPQTHQPNPINVQSLQNNGQQFNITTQTISPVNYYQQYQMYYPFLQYVQPTYFMQCMPNYYQY